MMVETDLIDNKVIDRFIKLCKKEALAHAYLFSGPASVGKFETAINISQLLNCSSSIKGLPCLECSNCKNILEGNHPDIHVIDNGSSDSIKIDQIRILLGQIKLRSFFGDKKIFIIRHCEKLTLESSNALLKTLEEPSTDSLLILTTSKREYILPTIRSRCHHIHFEPFSNDKLEMYLGEKKWENKQENHFLAYFTEGCLGKAVELKNSNAFDQKNVIIDKFIILNNSEDFLKKITTDKDKTKEFLDLLLSWLRDTLLIKTNVTDNRLIHLDRIADLEKFSKKYSFEELNSLYQDTVKTLKMLLDNLNVKMPLLIIKEQL
jgi:DNA polymerase-3 subunit delta'